MLGPSSTTDVTGGNYIAFIGGNESFVIENGANATINNFAVGANNDRVDLTSLLANASSTELSSSSNLFSLTSGPVKFTYNNSTSVTLGITDGVNGASGTATLTLNAAPGTNFGNNITIAESSIFNVLKTPTHT